MLNVIGLVGVLAMSCGGNMQACVPGTFDAAATAQVALAAPAPALKPRQKPARIEQPKIYNPKIVAVTDVKVAPRKTKVALKRRNDVPIIIIGGFF